MIVVNYKQRVHFRQPFLGSSLSLFLLPFLIFSSVGVVCVACDAFRDFSNGGGVLTDALPKASLPTAV